MKLSRKLHDGFHNLRIRFYAWYFRGSILDDAMSRRISGFSVHLLAKHSRNAAACFDRVARALDVIAGIDRRRLDRIRRSVKRIIVMPHRGHEYDPVLGAIILRETVIQQQSELELALTIVHEAAHARIHWRGVPFVGDLRRRIEVACVGEQLAFARRAAAPPDIERRLIENLNTEWWTEEAFLERRVSELRAGGSPEWSLRLFRRVKRWTQRLDRHRGGR